MADEPQVEPQTEEQDVAPEPTADPEPSLGLPEGIDLFGESRPEPAAEEPTDGDQEPSSEPEGDPEPSPEPSPEPEPGALPPEIQRMVDEAARRDVQLREREQKISAHERELRYLELLKEDPIEGLRKMGIQPETMYEKAMGLETPKTPTEVALEKKLDALLSERETEKQQQARQAEQQRQAQAREHVLGRMKGFAEKAESFPHVKAFHETIGPQTMFVAAEDFARQTGQWLPDEKAAKVAEEKLKRDMEFVLGLAQKMPEYADRFVKAASSNGVSQKDKQAPTSTPPQRQRTLRNKDNAEPPSKAAPPDLTNASDGDLIAAGLSAWAEVASGEE